MKDKLLYILSDPIRKRDERVGTVHLSVLESQGVSTRSTEVQKG